MDDTIHRELVWARLDPAAIRLLESVRPLFIGLPGRAPKPIGSCVLLRVGPARLLLTAAHVIDEFVGNDMLISGNGVLEGIRGNSVKIEPQAGQRRDEEIVDAGVLRIADDLPLSVDSSFLTPAAIGIEEPIAQGRFYLGLGYLVSRIRINPESRRTDSRPAKYLGRRAEAAAYNTLGVHPSTHVAIEFDQGATATDDGIRPVMNPVGMSGGGLWWWRNPEDRYALPELRLTGVLTEHRRSQKLILATRVRYHIALMRRRWPDLLPYLEGFPVP